MGAPDREIKDFSEGVLHASRLTMMGRQINELTKLVNALLQDQGRATGLIPAYFSNLSAVEGVPATYLATAVIPNQFRLYTKADDANAGEGRVPQGISVTCEVTNVAEPPNDDEDHELTSGDTQMVGGFLGFLTSEFTHEGKRIGYCWGFDLTDCDEASGVDDGTY